jgi:uncharacterized membrane protein YcgQ (UPF0703/DUF1980 family)
MRNSVKIMMALFIGVFLFSFQNESEVVTYNSSKKFVAADTLTWKLLGEIKYMKKKHASYGEVDFPIINTKLKKLAKKTIVMSGFIVPIDNKNYALSKNVFAACFFCGKSGPETIMGIKFKGATPKLKTDTYLTIKGTFRPNENDVEDWIYNCDNAEIVKGN